MRRAPNGGSTSVEQGGSLFPAFQSWSRSSSLQLQMIHPKELDDPQMFRDNRGMMLCYLASTHALPVKELMSGVLTVCKKGTTLSELERRFATAHPILVRSAVCRLVLRGEVRCAALALEPLGPYRTGCAMKQIACGGLRFDRSTIPLDLTDIGQWPAADVERIKSMVPPIFATTIFDVIAGSLKSIRRRLWGSCPAPR